MSLTDEVACRLHKTHMDTNELAALLPQYRRDQISTALTQAKRRGLIVKVRDGGQGRKGAAALWHGVALSAPRKAPPKKDRPPRVASVWDLARGGPTPIPFIAPGRRYEPLGAWPE